MHNWIPLVYILYQLPAFPRIQKKWEGNGCHQEAVGVVHALLHNPWNCHCKSWVHHFDKSQGYSLLSSGDSGSSVAEYRWWRRIILFNVISGTMFLAFSFSNPSRPVPVVSYFFAKLRSFEGNQPWLLMKNQITRLAQTWRGQSFHLQDASQLKNDSDL